jgi:putative spermidine/putrescine transport system ATP-binding protein
MSAVEFKAVSKIYGPVRAVDEVSLSVEPGEFATVLGPSGSGKTTMLSLIAGIMPPTSGQILVGGQDVTWTPARERNVGLVFQSYALFPHLSVFENVAFPLRIRGLQRREIDKRVREALNLVRLEGFDGRRPHQLSGGQQQRVALARAIVFKPLILLLDEPLAALDRKLREEVRLELRRLQRELGITTILVTHDQDEALSMSDRVIVLHAGRVQQIDRPIDIYHRPRNRFVADFLGIANFLEGSLHTGAGGAGIVLESGEVAPCSPASSQSRVIGVLRPELIRVRNGVNGTGLHGQIAETVFFGESVRYAVRLESGRTLIAHNADSRSSFVEGTKVTVDWDPDSVWILPADGMEGKSEEGRN